MARYDPLPSRSSLFRRTAGAPMTAPTGLRPGDPDPPAPGCDRCGATAYVTLEHETQILTFCGHHADAHLTALLAAGWAVVHDARDELA